MHPISLAITSIWSGQCSIVFGISLLASWLILPWSHSHKGSWERRPHRNDVSGLVTVQRRTLYCCLFLALLLEEGAG